MYYPFPLISLVLNLHFPFFFFFHPLPTSSLQHIPPPFPLLSLLKPLFPSAANPLFLLSLSSPSYFMPPSLSSLVSLFPSILFHVPFSPSFLLPSPSPIFLHAPPLPLA